jgi:superfamily II DNA or RNA helicase
MREFLSGGGAIRMICSPRISPHDHTAFHFGYRASGNEDLVDQLGKELERMLASDTLCQPTRLLACLYSLRRLEVQFAEVSDDAPGTTKRMFHDKTGLFIDHDGDVVGFRGSMNETFLGLSPTMGHIDSIDVFPSWLGGRESTRVDNALKRFEHLWSGGESRVGVRMFRIPPPFAERLDRIGEEVDLETVLDEVERLKRSMAVAPLRTPRLWEHQDTALAAWEQNGRRGILAHATGSGKTFSGCEAIRRVIAEGNAALVVVPSKEIQRQWHGALAKFTTVEPILCGGDGIEWREGGLLRSAANSNRPFVVIGILDTARQASFLRQLAPAAPRLLLVADEVHRIGAPSNARIMETWSAHMRLGLSATPERAGDPVGTAKVFDYFGGVIDAFQIEEALRAGRLTPYTYQFETVALTSDEQARWDAYSRRIRALSARIANRSSDEARLKAMLRRLLQDRARVKKAAAGKVSLAARTLVREYQGGHRWLIYCDNRQQLSTLHERLASSSVPVRDYHSKMAGDREGTLRWLAEHGGAVLSIRCLDEGVDIPSASHGLILASSTNRREFIQRRGRLLRKESGKHLASLWDAIVLPAEGSEQVAETFLAPELARALLFARSSQSPSAVTDLEDLCIHYGIALDRLDEFAQEGVEGDE